MATPTSDETEYQENVICPYCGYIDRDSWEIDFGPGLEGDTTVSCSACNREFWVDRTVSVTYTSRPLETDKEDMV